MPERVQRKRTKGWKMPPNTVYVGRPSPWGNPFRCYGSGERMSPEDAVFFFRDKLETLGFVLTGRGVITAEGARALRGKNLACWCPLGQPCHADVLLELANRLATGGNRT